MAVQLKRKQKEDTALYTFKTELKNHLQEFSRLLQNHKTTVFLIMKVIKHPLSSALIHISMRLLQYN